ncbi:MAG TPA: hypothetical protein PKY77_03110 [Phycisphaerae bacterium]|nr:hypothetical protein [Phycisphaerae bacterium]HRY67412.1 hypothetical protein [Phycisphaerae bacterium]HSA28997.1 hypothetical protein [Phycisphaerae bacterium]
MYTRIMAGLGSLVVCVLASVAVAANTTDFTRPYDVDTNTVVLYHVDNTATDEVGFHDGVLYGDAGYVPAKFGSGLGLDGSGDYMRAGNVHVDPSRDLSQGTVELWFKLDQAPPNFVLTGSGTEYGSYWDDGFFFGRHTGYSNNLVFMLWSGSWEVADTGMAPESLVGEWHHAAGTWGPAGLEVWLDGQVMGTNPYTGGLPNPSYQTMLIGTDAWTWATPGVIDEVRVSDVQRRLVPEPATLILAVMLGSLVLVLARRRR